MAVIGLRKVTVGQNGTAGAFILACKKMEFHFCDFYGSSIGMNLFLKHNLAKFAKAHPQIEITVSPRPNKHPTITGHYVNGKMKSICVRNLTEGQILQKAELLRDASGEKLKKTTKPVQSIKESVRGIWSPHHGARVTV